VKRLILSELSGSAGGGRRACSAQAGARVWSTYLKRDPLRYESFYASASTDGRRLYTIARSGRVVALSLATGKVDWSKHINAWGYSTPALAPGLVLVGGFDGALHAYRASSGDEVWASHVGGRILGAPVVIGPLVLFATLEEHAYAARLADGKVVCAEDDWTLNGGYGFDMQFRVNFRNGNVHFGGGKLKVYPADGEGFEPELPRDDGYYREICYFIDCIQHGRRPETCTPESARDTIAIALAEQASADEGGRLVRL
jgi:outer membrane protein assembly factor BamB